MLTLLSSWNKPSGHVQIVVIAIWLTIYWTSFTKKINLFCFSNFTWFKLGLWKSLRNEVERWHHHIGQVILKNFCDKVILVSFSQFAIIVLKQSTKSMKPSSIVYLCPPWTATTTYLSSTTTNLQPVFITSVALVYTYSFNIQLI